MAVGVERRAKKVASRLDQALLLQPVSNAMSYNPLTQTTGVGLSAPTTSIHTSEDRHEYNHTLPAQAALPSPQQPAHKKRRPSKDKTTTAIRRSSSTPHMRNLALGTTGELSPTSDKRRNKLGYHRTSVACGKQDAEEAWSQEQVTDVGNHRPLSTKEDSMPRCQRRAHRSLRKLHSTEEGMQLLSC